MLLVSAPSEIVRLLTLNLCPPTDNLEALVALGFQREFPTVAAGERAHIWMRQIVHESTGRTQRKIQKQRARLSFIANSAADAQQPINKAELLRDAHDLQRRILELALASAA
jgi:hypothetical protein